MADIWAQIKINNKQLGDIEDAERFAQELIDDRGEIELTIDLTDGNETVYDCSACGIQVTADGEPTGAYEGDASQSQCSENPDYGDHTCGEDCDTPTDEDGDGGCDQNGEPKAAPHVPTVAPLGWLHSIDVTTKPSQDEAVIRINMDNLDSPLVIYVERLEYTPDGETRPCTEYRLQVPHPDQSSDSPLIPLSGAGVYQVGTRDYHDTPATQ